MKMYPLSRRNCISVHQKPLSMGYVSDFSSNGNLFALLDSDGSLKIWDVEKNFLARPNHHLKLQYVCFTWLKVCNKDAVECYQDYIALGKKDGGVDLYSYVTGGINCTLEGDGHMGAVASICSHNSMLYTCGNDHRIVGWSLEDNKQCWKTERLATSPTCIIFLPSDYLLVACHGLSLWSLQSNNVKPAMKFQFVLHSTNVSTMKMMKQINQNEVYVLTSSTVSQEIVLWKINVDKMSVDATVLIKSANFISCSILDNKLMVTAVNTSSNGADVDFYVDEISKMKSNNTDSKTPQMTLSLTSICSDKNPRFVPIVVATLKGSNKSTLHSIQIGYGNSSSLRFEKISIAKRKHTQMLKLQVHDPRSRTHSESILTLVRDGDGDGDSNVTNGGLMKINIGGLMLALDHSDTILRAFFCIQNKHMIDSTLRQLSDKYIIKLVEELTLLIQGKRFNVGIAKCWLDSLLQVVSSHSITFEANTLRDKMQTLLGLLQHKIRFLPQLLRVKGRLDLLLSQRMMYMNDSSILLSDQDALVHDIAEVHLMVQWEDGDKSTDEEGHDMDSSERLEEL